MQHIVYWLVFVAAAFLEVGGDALVRKGMRKGGIEFVILGCLMIGVYGIVVNLAQWDFSRLLGVYVAVFATVGTVTGMLYFDESIPTATWIGLALIIAGGLVIQFGR